MPRKSWKINTKTVAAYAHGLVPTDKRAATMTKHTQRPAAEIMRDDRRPNRSMLQRGMIDPTRYASEVHPPRIKDRLRDSFIAFW
jgi:hypothetical protein